MRLAVVNHHGREPAGSELSLLRYLELLPRDIEPTLFLFEDGAFAEMSRKRYPTVMVPMSDRIAGTSRSSLGIRAAVDAVGLVSRLGTALRANRIDVVLTNSVKAHYIGMLAARLQRLPCVLYLHDVLHGKALAALRALTRACTSTRMACSRLAANSLALDDTAVLYSPVDIERFERLPAKEAARAALGIPNDGKPVVGLVGRIARWKGQDRFIRIAARVLERHEAHFAIVGAPLFGCDDAYPEELAALANRLGVAHAIRYIPWQDDLPTVYAALDVACNCSTEEPFGRTTIEAMAAMLPVICFDDAGACETFENECSGYHVATYDEPAFADRISMLLADPSLRMRFGVAARDQALQLKPQYLAPIFERSLRLAASR